MILKKLHGKQAKEQSKLAKEGHPLAASLYLGACLLALPGLANADPTSILNNFTNYIVSWWGGGAVTLAIIAAGYYWLGKGTLSATRALSIIGGATLIFGASAIYQAITGG